MSSATAAAPVGGDNTPAVSRRGLAYVIRASGMSRCVRSLVAYAQGLVPEITPRWYRDAQKPGKLWESRLKALIRKRWKGWDLSGDLEQKPHELKLTVPVWLTDPNTTDQAKVIVEVILSGHLDSLVTCAPEHLPAWIERFPGLAGWDGSLAVLEAKSFGKSQFPIWMRHRFVHFVSYKKQVATYALITGLPVIVMAGNRELPTGEELDVTFHPSIDTLPTLAKVRTFAHMVTTTPDDELPECQGPESNDDKKGAWCPFCWTRDEVDEETASAAMDKRRLGMLLKRDRKHVEKIEKLKTQIEAETAKRPLEDLRKLLGTRKDLACELGKIRMQDGGTIPDRAKISMQEPELAQRWAEAEQKYRKPKKGSFFVDHAGMGPKKKGAEETEEN